MGHGKTQKLGDLERLVMNALWSAHDGLTVREIASLFPRHAYTTVLTVCDRLCTKGLVSRELEGRAHRYAPTLSHEQYITDLMEAVLTSSGNRSAALVHFVDSMDGSDLQLVRQALRRRKH